MTLSHELQNLVADVNVAIAERKTWGRTELEKLRRNLAASARAATKEESAAATAREALGQLVAGVETGVADLAGLARRSSAAVEVAR